MSGSVLMRSNTRSMTSRNSSADLKSLAPIPRREPTSQKCGAALDQVFVDLALDGLADPLGELEHERAVLGRLRGVTGNVDRLAEFDPPLGRQRHGSERAEQRERRGNREERRAGQAGEQRQL